MLWQHPSQNQVLKNGICNFSQQEVRYTALGFKDLMKERQRLQP